MYTPLFLAPGNAYAAILAPGSLYAAILAPGNVNAAILAPESVYDAILAPVNAYAAFLAPGNTYAANCIYARSPGKVGAAPWCRVSRGLGKACLIKNRDKCAICVRQRTSRRIACHTLCVLIHINLSYETNFSVLIFLKLLRIKLLKLEYL